MRAYLAVLLSFLLASVTQGATITGQVVNAQGHGFSTTAVFMPTSTPLPDGTAIVVGPAQSVNTDTNGNFSIVLSTGNYYCVLAGIDRFLIYVPGDTNSYNITALGPFPVLTMPYFTNLFDVTNSPLYSNGQVPTYDSTTKKFKPGTGGGGGTNVNVNGSVVVNPNFTNSTNIILSATSSNIVLVVTNVSSSQIVDGTIVDGDIAASGIATRSKLPTTIAYEDEANIFTLNQQINGSLQVATNVAAGSLSATSSITLGGSNVYALAAGANTTFTTNGPVLTISSIGGGGGTNVNVNGTVVVNPNFTNSTNVQLFATSSNITMIVTNVASSQIVDGTVVDADIASTGITTRSKLPSSIAYEDEANNFSPLVQTFNGIIDNGGIVSSNFTFWAGSLRRAVQWNVPAINWSNNLPNITWFATNANFTSTNSGAPSGGSWWFSRQIISNYSASSITNTLPTNYYSFEAGGLVSAVAIPASSIMVFDYGSDSTNYFLATGGKNNTALAALAGLALARFDTVAYDGTNFTNWSEGTVNRQTGTSYTFVTADRGKLVTFTNASTVAVTLPQATNEFGPGWFVWTENHGAGNVTITPTISNIEGASSLVLSNNQGVVLFSNGTNYFTMRGVGGGGGSGNVLFTDFNTNQFNTNGATWAVNVKSGSKQTNNYFYGPMVFQSAPQSTNIDWATNAFAAQGIATNASFTNTFQNHPPVAGSWVSYQVWNTAATNISVIFMVGTAIATNNISVPDAATNVTSISVPPGITYFDWGYNGNNYVFDYRGRSGGTNSAAGTAAEVQYRNGATGAFAAEGVFSYNSTNDTLSVPNINAQSSISATNISAYASGSSGLYSLRAFAVGGGSAISVDGSGQIVFGGGSFTTGLRGVQFKTSLGFPLRFFTSASAVTGIDHIMGITANTNGMPVTLLDCTNDIGAVFVFFNTGTNTASLQPNPTTETINGATNLVLNVGDYASLISDGSNWLILSRGNTGYSGIGSEVRQSNSVVSGLSLNGSTTNNGVGASKVIVTGSDGVEKGATLSGLTFDGTTLTASGGALNLTDFNVNQFNTNGATYAINIKHGSKQTNNYYYGPLVFPSSADSTNIDWATNAFASQGIVTNASFTNTFQNHPPAANSSVQYVVVNTAATNIQVIFMVGTAIATNNFSVPDGLTNALSITVPAGSLTYFDWSYDGNRYVVDYRGKNSGTTYAVYAAGTPYTTTATPALADFGTTDPSLTISEAGTYLLVGHAGIQYNAATYGGAQTITIKLRKTSGTAADVPNALRTTELPVLTGFTGGDASATAPVLYTAGAGDVIQLWASVSATPAAGSVLIDSADVMAIKIIGGSGGAGGGVTSVAQTVPSQFQVTGSPITTSGTLAITLTNFSGTTNGPIIVQSNATVNGVTLTGSTTNSAATASRFATFDANKVLSTSGASADLAATLSDETGSGAAVFGTGPTLASPVVSAQTNSDGTASTFVVLDSTKKMVSTGTSAMLRSTLSDEVGTGPAMFTRVGVVRSFDFPMGAWFTNGVGAPASVGSWTNTADSFAFADAVTNTVRIRYPFPVSWDAGVVRFQLVMGSTLTNNTTSTNVVFGIKGASIGTGEFEDALTFGTQITFTNHIHRSPYKSTVCTTGDLTVGNTPAANKDVVFELTRLTSDAADVNTNTVNVLDVQVFYTESATEPSMPATTQ